MEQQAQERLVETKSPPADALSVQSLKASVPAPPEAHRLSISNRTKSFNKFVKGSVDAALLKSTGDIAQTLEDQLTLSSHRRSSTAPMNRRKSTVASVTTTTVATEVSEKYSTDTSDILDQDVLMKSEAEPHFYSKINENNLVKPPPASKNRTGTGGLMRHADITDASRAMGTVSVKTSLDTGNGNETQLDASSSNSESADKHSSESGNQKYVPPTPSLESSPANSPKKNSMSKFKIKLPSIFDRALSRGSTTSEPPAIKAPPNTPPQETKKILGHHQASSLSSVGFFTKHTGFLSEIHTNFPSAQSDPFAPMSAVSVSGAGQRPLKTSSTMDSPVVFDFNRRMSENHEKPIRESDESLDHKPNITTSQEDLKQKKKRAQQQILSMITPNKLFEFFAIVSLTVEDAPSGFTVEPGSKKKPPQILKPTITYQYPPSKDANSPLKPSPTSTESSTESLNLDASLPENVPLFSFPEWSRNGAEMTIDEYLREDSYSRTSSDKETFSFVLTSLDHSKRFGYCRRIASHVEVEGELPVKVAVNPGDKAVKGKENAFKTVFVQKKKKLLEVLCIVSPAGSFALFHQILDIVEKKRKSESIESVSVFLRAVMKHPYPRLGKSVTILVKKPTVEEYQLFRPYDLVSLEHVSFPHLLRCLGLVSSSSFPQSLVITQNMPIHALITLFTAILFERRIILTSHSLQKLSDCGNATAALLTPFEWQHAFIPILPRRLLEFLCSPTPYIIGVLSSDIGKVVSSQRGFKSDMSMNVPASPDLGEKLDLEEVLVINLDTGQILRNDYLQADRNRIPFYFIHRLKFHLERAYKQYETEVSTGIAPQQAEQKLNIAIADSFQKIYILLIGSYREFMDVDIVPGDRNISRSTSPISDHSNGSNVISNKGVVKVAFDINQFIQQHPIIVGLKDSPWYHEMSRGSNEQQPAIPTTSQRPSIQQFLATISQSQSFQFFIQIREEAFQYHYQSQLEGQDINNLLADSSEASKKKTAKHLPNGLRYYYELAQSRFEKKISQIELKYKNGNK